MSPGSNEFVSFAGHQLICRGALQEVALGCKAQLESGESQRVVIYKVDVGQPVDVDFTGSDDEVLHRLQARFPEQPTGAAETGGASIESAKPRGRGRPRLGVVSREVSLLPRHWQWLGEQRGGASAALRRLVEAAASQDADAARVRQAISAAHSFMWDIAGNLENFEEATRSLFGSDFHRFEALIAPWPADIRDQLSRYVDQARPGEG
jgi:hypothetical protein